MKSHKKEVKKHNKKGKNKIIYNDKKHTAQPKIYMKNTKIDKNNNINENNIEENEDNSNEESNEEEYEEFTIKLSMLYFGQCDPKKCTGKKMERLGLLREMKFTPNYSGILLTPDGKKFCSIEDHDIIEKNGICVIDCSWAKFKDLHLNLSRIETRKLPFMVAVNPVNFGKAFKLTCAEAFAGCLFLGGFEKEANFIMDHFSWGNGFFKVNQELFDKYRDIKSQSELQEIQEKYINEELENKEKRKNSDGLTEFNNEVNRINEEDEINEESQEEEEVEEKIDMNMFKNIDINENDFCK